MRSCGVSVPAYSASSRCRRGTDRGGCSRPRSGRGNHSGRATRCASRSRPSRPCTSATKSSPAGRLDLAPAAPRRRSPRVGSAGSPRAPAPTRPPCVRTRRGDRGGLSSLRGRARRDRRPLAARGEGSRRRDRSNRQRRPCPTLAAWVRSSAIAPPPAVRWRRRGRRPSSATRWSSASPAAAWPSLPSSPVVLSLPLDALAVRKIGIRGSPSTASERSPRGSRGSTCGRDEGLGEAELAAGRSSRRARTPSRSTGGCTSGIHLARSAARQRCSSMTGSRPAPP